MGGKTRRLSMGRKATCCRWCGAFVLAASTCAAAAGDPGCCGEEGQRRAGWPQQVSCLAVPTDTGHYVGYAVGGGVPCLGGPPCADDGTWGWDYSGWLYPRQVMLRWTHGRRYQGGVGAYRTTGINRESKSTP
jgi:hypothetical protein